MNTLLTVPQAASLIPDNEEYEIQSTSTYLLARDEDCENSFHSTADFVSIPVPSCSLLFSSVLFCFLLFSSVFSCSLLFSSVLSCSLLFSSVLSCSLLFSSVSSCSLLFSLVPFCSHLFFCQLISSFCVFCFYSLVLYLPYLYFLFNYSGLNLTLLFFALHYSVDIPLDEYVLSNVCTPTSTR